MEAGPPSPRQSAMLQMFDRFVLLVALAVLAWLFWRNAVLASREIDGVRYFVLDDDMMISMRYGRNLIEGRGLEWNPGDRVEGYTNFLWTIVMAAAHLVPVAAAKAALVLKAIAFGLMAASFYFSSRIVRLFAPRALVATPLLFACMLTCADVLHWAVWGFETSLLTFLNLFFLLRILEARKTGVLAYAALALIPLTRSDSLHVFLADATIAVVLSHDPRKTIKAVALALVPFGAHLLFRRAYYGEWLPNTYYLKVYQLDGTTARGATYARNFLLRYGVLLALAAGSGLAIGRTDRRAVTLFATVLVTLGYVIFTGGDMFFNFRFFAHVMPIVFVFAAAGVATVVRDRTGSLVWTAILFLISVPLVRPLEKLIVLDTNGDPYEQLQVAMLMKKNALPESSVAVITAGILPYFTRMRAIDILGKSDRHIAHLRPFPGSMVGHGKLDPAYTLAHRPDLVVSCRSHALATTLASDARTTDVVLSFLSASAFQTAYRNYPIHEEFLEARTAVYTFPESKEYGRRDWQSVVVRP